MDNFLASRPKIAKLGVPSTKAANVFASLTNQATTRTGAAPFTDAHAMPTLPDPAAPGHQAKVEVVQENGAVHRIVVICKCGERVELDCVY